VVLILMMNVVALSYLNKRLCSIRAEETAVPLKCHTVDQHEGDIFQAHAPHSPRAKRAAKPLVQVGRDRVVKANVVVARHHAYLLTGCGHVAVNSLNKLTLSLTK
jgi:hypothetical protein